MHEDRKLFCFGFGYTALSLARLLSKEGWVVTGTSRSTARIKKLASYGFTAHLFNSDRPKVQSTNEFKTYKYFLISIPPQMNGDAVIQSYMDIISKLKKVVWVGYLSTTGVYGDSNGAMVDEKSPLNPTSNRSKRRVDAEKAWQASYKTYGLPIHIFRLPGIYGSKRSVFNQIDAGRHKVLRKPGHKFSRIHVDDIASALSASIKMPKPGAIYNVCDDEPAPPANVTKFACHLLQIIPPPEINWEKAKLTMSPMALSFWQDNRTIDNSLIKNELGWALKYPTYREGLRAIFNEYYNKK